MTYVVVNHIWWCDLPQHMSYITEIQGAVVFVIIWWCDLQLHMSCITEIQEAVVVVIIWWCDLQPASCISVIHDICSCKSHHRIKTITTAPCISVIHDICSCKSTRSRRGRDHMVVWFTTTYVMYYWNARGRRDRYYTVVWFKYMTYVVVNHTTIWSRPRRLLVFQ
jgi:hypothetical protein